MAQYKVPQDVEADDKLLGPFTFRQFIYLIIVAGFIALAWALFQVFPLLVIIPLPIVIFFGALALPLKKDQPMETYLAAIVSYYLKPHRRFWHAGQPESTIEITAPKTAEASRVRDISEDEASHRLSFLAEVVDSEGQSIKSAYASPMREEFYAEASATSDMFDVSTSTSQIISEVIDKEDSAHHAEAIAKMKESITKAETITTPPPISHNAPLTAAIPPAPKPEPPKPVAPPPTPQLVDLANDKDLSVATIAKEAHRLKHEPEPGEVYISLH
jgi:hypothetical protein